MTQPGNSTHEGHERRSDRLSGPGEASGREGEVQFAETGAYCEDQIIKGAIHRPILNPNGGRR